MFWQIMTFIVSALGIIAAITLTNYPPAAPNLTVMYSPPPANPYEQAVAASGLVEAYEDNIFIGLSVQDVIQEVHCKVGDHVKENQLLFVVDESVPKAQVKAAEAAVAVAQAELEKNKSQLSRLTAIRDTRAVSVEDLRNKEHDVQISENNLKNAQANLFTAQQNLLQRRTYAPKDGVILKMDLRRGEFASSYAATVNSPNDAPIVLGRTDKLQVRADVDEYNAFRIRNNQAAVAYTKGVAQVPLPLTFMRFEPYCVPKKSLTAAADERVDTRVLQVIYSFDVVKDFPVYVGQQVDIFINAPIVLHNKESHEAALKQGIDLRQ
ncbi:MAG: secretion protein HlyD [Verrucomicrobia bacterium]|nr:secretion protein HlyD [Verrucomicrobiota bacterium]MBS0636257.1 secretion protein HlyD [Verrucomicrobiota bacterium]